MLSTKELKIIQNNLNECENKVEKCNNRISTLTSKIKQATRYCLEQSELDDYNYDLKEERDQLSLSNHEIIVILSLMGKLGYNRDAAGTLVKMSNEEFALYKECYCD